jgi:hypothetical protein
VSQLRRFFHRWKGFFLTDGLMYLVFVVTFVILFAFFR